MLMDRIHKYLATLRKEIRRRRSKLKRLNKARAKNEKDRELQMRLANEWHLRSDVRQIIESRGIHALQRINHMEQVETLAIDAMERRIAITSGFQQYLVELANADKAEKEAAVKQLMDEQRTIAFFAKPKELLKREEQRLAMKEFVRHLDAQVAEATETVKQIQHLDPKLVIPISDARRLEELRSIVTKETTFLVQLDDDGGPASGSSDTNGGRGGVKRKPIDWAMKSERDSMKNQVQYVSLLNPQTCLSIQGRLVRNYIRGRDGAASAEDASHVRAFTSYLALALHKDMFMKEDEDDIDEGEELGSYVADDDCVGGGDDNAATTGRRGEEDFTESALLLLTEALVHSQLPRGYCMALETEDATEKTQRWRTQISRARSHNVNTFKLPAFLESRATSGTLFVDTRKVLQRMCGLQRSGPTALVAALMRFVRTLFAEYSAYVAADSDGGDASLGADTLFPSFLYCVTYADVPNLPHIMSFMETYSYFETPTIKMHSERGAYYFEMLRAAVAWVLDVAES